MPLPPTARELLQLSRLPARLTSDQAAVILGFNPHDVPVLVARRLLVPLGRPAPNGTKYFAALDVEKCAVDRNWLDKATRAISQHWVQKNRRNDKYKI